MVPDPITCVRSPAGQLSNNGTKRKRMTPALSRAVLVQFPAATCRRSLPAINAASALRWRGAAGGAGNPVGGVAGRARRFCTGGAATQRAEDDDQQVGENIRVI